LTEVGETSVDEIFRTLGIPPEELRRLRNAMSLQVEGNAAAAVFQQGLEAVMDSLGGLAACRVAVRLRGMRDQRSRLFTIILQGNLLATPVAANLIDEDAIGDPPEIGRRKARVSLTLFSNLCQSKERDLDQVVLAVRQPGRADRGDGPGETLPKLRKVFFSWHEGGSSVVLFQAGVRPRLRSIRKDRSGFQHQDVPHFTTAATGSPTTAPRTPPRPG
jgi:hypothetical protein